MEIMEWSPTSNSRKKLTIASCEEEDKLRRKSLRKENFSPRTTTKRQRKEKPVDKQLPSKKSFLLGRPLLLSAGSVVGRQGICLFCAEGILYEISVDEQTRMIGEGVLEIFQTGGRIGRLDFSTESKGSFVSMELDPEFIVQKGISPRMVILNEQHIIKLSNLVVCQELVYVITSICNVGVLQASSKAGGEVSSFSCETMMHSKRLCDSPMQLCDC